MKINSINQRFLPQKTQNKNIYFNNKTAQDTVTLTMPRKDLNLIINFINSQISQTNMALNGIEYDIIAKRHILSRLSDQYEIRGINSQITKLNKEHQRLENTFNKLSKMLNALTPDK
ncbi:MAG TPA: hypothetical protein PKI94_08475 [Candidatus Gastranaerophilaceae bacterium]|nr:hypothetical protein [Candidatus Gastranaerophilaceae bacterium]